MATIVRLQTSLVTIDERFYTYHIDRCMGKVVPIKRKTSKGEAQNLSVHDALKMVRQLAQDSKNVFVVTHAQTRQRQRQISRRQIMTCLQKGVITEGPFLNHHGNWQVNVSRIAAGQSITCVVAIELERKLIVVTVF